MKADEAAVYDFCNELQEEKSVSDSAFKAAVDQFGERGVVDLIRGDGLLHHGVDGAQCGPPSDPGWSARATAAARVTEIF